MKVLHDDEIRTIIKRSGVTQKRISELTGINTAYLSQFMNNLYEPDSERLLKLSECAQKLKAIL